MNRSTSTLILILLLLLQVTPIATLIAQGSRVGFHEDFPHARVVVTSVVDGNKFHISPPVYVMGDYRTIVRLADIEPKSEAKTALEDLIHQYNNTVLLDIDKSIGVDEDGRIIAVAYVRENDTHILNVNKWMVENNKAVISDYANDFDPQKWSLYLEYHVGSEKLPRITRKSVYTGGITNATSWGVKTAVTPDGRYLAIAFSEAASPYALNVVILDNQGEIVKSERYGPERGPTWRASVFRGMLDIAANGTGFLVAWTNDTYVSVSKVVLYSYIPVVGSPTTPSYTRLFAGQFHPTVAFFRHYNGSRWWVVGYGRHLTDETNYIINLLNLDPVFTGRFVRSILANGSTTDLGTTPRVGVDVLSGLIYDPDTTNFTIVARQNKTSTPGGTPDHDILAIIGRSHPTLGFSLTSFKVDDRDGDQGPEPTIYFDRSYYRTYFDLYPSIYTKLLSNGRYVLTVYNESASSLAYAIIDLNPTTPVITRGTLLDRGVDTTFYPWISANSTHWFVAWSAADWINASLVGVSGPVKNLVLADRNASFVRATYDPGSGLFVIPYAVTDKTGTRNIYIAFYNAANDTIEPWILPVARIPNVHETPLHVAALSGGSASVIALVALEGDELVVYFIQKEYPELLVPIPIPESLYVAVAVVLVATIIVVIVRRKAALY